MHDRIAVSLAQGLSPAEREILDEHLSSCPDCCDHQAALSEDHRRMAGLARSLTERMARLEESVIEAVKLDAGNDGSPWVRTGSTRHGVFERRSMRYALAAVVAICMFLGANWLTRRGTPGVAWAAVIQKVVEAQDYICRIDKKTGIGPDMEIVQYCSGEYGVRQDLYEDGRHVASVHVTPDDQRMVVLVHKERRYTIIEMSEEDLESSLSGSNSLEFVERFRMHEYRELGTREIDGVTASGIETDDREFWGGVYEEGRVRLWVDVETQWPVRFEFEGKADGGKIKTSMVMDGFKWAPQLAASDFVCEIPDDYRDSGTFAHEEANEETALTGLSNFARLLGGHYPSALVMATAIKDAKDLGEDLYSSGKVPRDDVPDLMKIQQSCIFFDELQREGRDPVYNGDRVDRADYDEILLRWRLDDGRYRVYYGDLRSEDVSGARLAELEKR
jgi:hypothetical protein